MCTRNAEACPGQRNDAGTRTGPRGSHTPEGCSVGMGAQGSRVKSECLQTENALLTPHHLNADAAQIVQHHIKN